MNFEKILEKELNYTRTENGALTHKSTLSKNLDFFASSNRKIWNEFDFKCLVNNALYEDLEMGVLNILHTLNIRGGKGERDSFKTAFKELINYDKEMSIKVLKAIPKLGRYDYLLEAMDTPIEKEMISIIKNEIVENTNGNKITLLAKWLPSLRTHKKNNEKAYKLAKLLGHTPKQYRKRLKELRSKLNIIETKLTNKDNDIDFSKVPSKAHLKYISLFLNRDKIYYKKYDEYKEKLRNGTNETSINMNNLFMDEIIHKLDVDASWDRIYVGEKNKEKIEMVDLMWKNQDKIQGFDNENILVVADTSGSMNGKPIETALALAIYFSENNSGCFKNKFITFSNEPEFHNFEDGLTLSQKLKGIKSIVANTDIDKVFDLILKTAIKNDVRQDELPKKILIVSDMQFDCGTNGEKTNFESWKNKFNENNYDLPQIIFWNVADNTRVFPVTKNNNGVILISGYNKQIIKELSKIEEFNPIEMMQQTLMQYKKYIK